MPLICCRNMSSRGPNFRRTSASRAAARSPHRRLSRGTAAVSLCRESGRIGPSRLLLTFTSVSPRFVRPSALPEWRTRGSHLRPWPAGLNGLRHRRWHWGLTGVAGEEGISLGMVALATFHPRSRQAPARRDKAVDPALGTLVPPDVEGRELREEL